MTKNHTNQHSPFHGLLLPGIDGTNPLGYLATIGTLATLHQAGQTHARLGWKRNVTWVPLLSGISINNPEDLSQILAVALRGKVVSEIDEEKRKTAQQDLDSAKKEVNDKRGEIKRRKLRGNDKKEAFDQEVAPLEEVLRQKRVTWLLKLKDAVPRPELAIGKHIDCTHLEYHYHATEFFEEASHAQRETLDLLAAFGSDACLKKKSERIEATSFCFITGSGHQYFLDTVRKLIDVVSVDRIHAALFEPWTYSDEKFSMRWDPLEDRRHALMDRDPTASDNKPCTVWMANLLAYRALVLFPSAPQRKQLATSAWGRHGEAPTFTWPIWEHPADIETIRSMLQFRELNVSNPDASVLRYRGIVAAYRARRIQVGNPPLHKINFSPAGGVF